MGILGDNIAVIESSQAIGYSLIKPKEMNPFIGSSYGVGELINQAVRKGVKKIIVTMGDSATMDIGVGMLYALGVKFYSTSGELITPTLQNLNQIVCFDDTKIRKLRENVSFLGLVDTNDYLCGKIGQVQLYGKQKGLKNSDIQVVESVYFNFSKLIESHFGIDVTKVVGATGSGGLAAALHSFLGADLVNTLEYFSERLPLHKLIGRADITVTGEGRLDNQTKLGKVPHFVASLSPRKCIGIVGSYTQEGFNDMKKACKQFSIFVMNPEIAMKKSKTALRDIATSVFSLFSNN